MLTWLVIKPFAVLALVAGAITLPTPLPIGAPLIAIGLAILVATSSTVRKWLKSARRRSGHVDGFVTKIEPRVGRRLGIALKRTRVVSGQRDRRGDAEAASKARDQPMAPSVLRKHTDD